jgi:hypothetical protein
MSDIKVGDQFMVIVKDGDNFAIDVERIDGDKVTCQKFVNPEQQFRYSISELNDTALFTKVEL